METLIYLGKVNLYWVIFYVCYRVFLHRHTFFVWNRTYLLSSLILAIILPAIHLPEKAPVLIQSAVYVVNTLPVYTSIPLPESSSPFPWELLIFAIVSAGAALMLARLLHVFRSLFKVISQGDAITFEDHALVLLPHNETGSFSFLKWLVINRNDYENNLDVILRHELTHIKQMHSYDILFIECLKTVCWFNPALWLYKHSIQEVHEFLADETAPNRERYATFLVSYGLQAPIQSLTNHFFNSSLLKNRIVMIYKARTSNWLLGKYAMIIPVILVIILSTASNRHLPSVPKKIAKISDHQQLLKITNDETTALEPAAKTNNTKANEISDIRGLILDQAGAPVPRASLLSDETLLGKTDENGQFLIKGINVNSRISVSHVTFAPQQFVVKKTLSNYKIILTRNKTMLNEVVVVGFRSIPKTVAPITAAPDSTTFNNSVQQMPEFPGGESEMYKYIAKNVHYPTEAFKANLEGSVFVSFTVSENGFIRKPRVVKGLGNGTDEEALRVILSMPKWKPAEQNGQKVSADYAMAIRFTLN